MSIQELQRFLSDRNLKEVSRRTGVPYSTLRGITKNMVEDPRKSTIDTLESYFRETCACKQPSE